jgi:iron(III) transport system permease protein
MTAQTVSPRPLGGNALGNVWFWLRGHALLVTILVILLLMVGVPLFFTLNMSVHDGTPALPGNFTLENYKRAYSNPLTWSSLKDTAIFATGVSVIALTISTAVAYLVERTDMPFRNFAWVVMLLPIAMPAMLSSMAWILLLNNKIGLLNVGIRQFLELFGHHDSGTGPLQIYSLPMMIIVEGLRGSTPLFLMIVSAFRLMDPSLEEAASMSGSSAFRTFRKVTLPMIMPALLAAGMYGFISNLDDVDAALLLGVPAGIYLLPALIFFVGPGINHDWGLSQAYTSLFVIISLLLVLVYYRVILRNAGKFTSVTGKAFRPRRVALGRWRWVAFGTFFVYFFVTIVMPFAILVWASLLPTYKVPSTDDFHRISLDNYTSMFTQLPGLRDAIVNTIELAVVTATLTMLFAFVVSWLVVRGKMRGRGGIDALVFLPHAIPSVAICMALIAFFLAPVMRWSGLYGTITLLVIAMMTRTITFASRTSNTAMTQLGAEIEEAAHVNGVGQMRTFFSITLRLLAPAFFAGWIYIAAASSRNLTIPLLLSTDSGGTIAKLLYERWFRNADFTGTSALGVCLIIVLTFAAILARRFVAAGYSDDSTG